MMILTPILVPLLAALVFALAGWRRSTVWLGAVSAAAMLGLAVVEAVAVVTTGPHDAGPLRIDALSSFMLIVIGAVALVAAVATPAYLRAEITAGRDTARTATRQSVLVQLVLAALALAVLAADLGVLWVAIEATTIVTAFLVGQRRSRAGVEAAWKYVVICSTGIALALLGIVVLNHAAQHAAGGPVGLDLAELGAAASGLDSGVTRIAVVLLIVGFGTKAGLAPLHAWLPDAYSQAPAPVSALMSGVLSSVACYAILRVKVISDAALGAGFARTLLAAMALASLVVAASLLLAQRDYKRLLAYSSIEHMALVALGAAIGTPLALAAALLHILGHGLVKASLFVGAGRILQVARTSRIAPRPVPVSAKPGSVGLLVIDGVRGLAARQPLLAGGFGFGVLALAGFPPFSVFASELGIVRAGFAAGLGWVTAAALVLVLVITAALVSHTSRMLFDEPTDTLDTAPLPTPTVVAIGAALLACAVIGIATGPLSTLIELAADTAMGSR